MSEIPKNSETFENSKPLESSKTVLIVESDDKTREILNDFLSRDFSCENASSANAAIDLISLKEFPVILMDYGLQIFNGMNFQSFVRSFSPHSSVIYLSEKESFRDAVEAFRAGAFDFIARPFRLPQIADSVSRAFEDYETKCLNGRYQIQLEETIRQTTRQLDKALEEVENSYCVTLKALVQALETRDYETHGHSERVVTFSLRLAYEIGLDEKQMRDLELGALLHDIGKIGVPDQILRKPAKLNEKEWEKMKLHPLHGFQILRDIPFLEGAAKIVCQHHERWDGSGYPNNLRGEEIDLCARIFTVADAFDAMTSDRIYRRGQTFDEALRELEKNSGTQFDPEIVRAFRNIPSEDWEILRDRSLKNKQDFFSFQAIVEELISKNQYFEMVH